MKNDNIFGSILSCVPSYDVTQVIFFNSIPFKSEFRIINTNVFFIKKNKK